jgi:hypothetical protein
LTGEVPPGKDCHIRKLNAIIEDMKKRTRSESQFMKEETEKTPLLRNVRTLREEIEEKGHHIHKQHATIGEIEETNTKGDSIHEGSNREDPPVAQSKNSERRNRAKGLSYP